MDDVFLRLQEKAKELGAEGNSAIGRLLNESPQVVTNWQKRGVPPKKYFDIAKAIDESVEWLKTGIRPRKEPTYNLSEDAIELPKRRRAPIISYVQAGNWCELVDAYPVGTGEDTIEIDAKWSPNTFVLRVRGDSMHPTLTEGALLVVDPNVEWMHNRIVVVRQNGDTEVTVKRLIKDGDTYYLKPDNSTYPLLKLDKDAHVCGVVVEQLTRFV